MITFKEKPDKEEAIFELLHPVVRKWFKEKFKEFSLPQKFAILEIHSRNNILVSAATGSGKTLTGFLSILNELIDSSEKGILKDKVYAVYISPLKALSRDIEINLKTPLEEIEQLLGKKLNIRINIRTGDTTIKEKAQMLKKPPHILITTPESLALSLSSPKFKEYFKEVDWCIIDEIHSLAENKRGTHLSLSIERLQHLSKGMCRIGLSATVSPLEEIAKFLVGNNKPCKIVDVKLLKELDLKVISPVPDLINITYNHLHAKLYELLDSLIQQHKTTLIFTNTRSATERIVHHLKETFPKNYTENIGAHHGSLSKQHRHELEDRLRKGLLKCVVCSTSLELGIDIGYIDLVICLGSPKSVARLLQRQGRSGHNLHDKIYGKIIVLDRDDLVECSVMLKNALENKIDKIHIPANCLDILAQQIIGMSLQQVWNEDELFNLVKDSYCYKNLERKDFNEVLSYLAGEFASLEDRYIYSKIWRNEGNLGKRSRSRVIYMTNIGTIPDESFITVKINEEVIGHLDEGFLEYLKRGDIFVLGGNTYEFKYAKGMVAQVLPAVGRNPTVPSWISEMLPLSFDLANDIQRFRKLMDQKLRNKYTKEEIMDFINAYLYVDKNASEAIYNYFKEQYDFLEIPHENKIIVEHYIDEDNKKYSIFHALFGRRVNDCLSRALAYAITKTQHVDVELGISDNGFYLSSEKKINVIKAFELLKTESFRAVLEKSIENSEVLRRRFRHCANRALMILRIYKGIRRNVGKQQVSSMILMSALKRINENFSILKEARREVMEDLMDIESTLFVLKRIENDEINIKEHVTRIPSPFAFNLALRGSSDILKAEDRQEFLQNMHNMVLAKIGLNK